MTKIPTLIAETTTEDFMTFLHDNAKPVPEEGGNICAALGTSFSWMKANKFKTLKDILNGYLADDSVPVDWALFLIPTYYDDFSEEIRLMWMEKITDPLDAFTIYRPLSLTEDEKKLLEGKFKGRLPKVEEEIRQGVIE